MLRFLTAPVLICLTAAAGFASTDSALLALVPANAKIVTGVNVQQALTSPFGQFLLTKTDADGNGFDKMLKDTGFDPRRDLQSFVFASAGPAGTGSQSSFVFVARGNFQSQNISKQITAHGGTAQNIGGIEVYLGNEHDQQTAFALLDSGIAVFGDLASVQQVIANRSSPSVLDPALQTLIVKVSAGNDAWFASTIGGTYLSQHLNDATNHQLKPQAIALQSVHQAAGGLLFGDPIQLSFDAITRSPQDAKSLVDVMRFAASFVQMQRSSGPQAEVLASAMDSMVVSAADNNFHASLAIPEKSLEQIADAGAQHHHGFITAKPSQR